MKSLPVIHFITSVDEAKHDIPLLFTSSPSGLKATNSVGTKNFDKPPKAILMGKKYTSQEIKEIRDACGSIEVSWITSGTEEKKSKFGISIPNPKAALADAEEIKARMQQLKTDGKLGTAAEYHY